MTVKGVVFIGDVHFSSIHPSSRHESYSEEVLHKIRYIQEFCNEKDYISIFLGDFFHRSSENNIFWLNKVFEVIASFKNKPYILAGNHDMDAKKLKERCTLSLLKSASIAHVIDTPEKIVIRGVDFSLNVYAEPFGMDFPKIDEPEQFNIGITHRGFDYFKEIEGIDIIFNGHEHLRKPPVQKGQTQWRNIGTLVRTSSVEAFQKPIIEILKNEKEIIEHQVPCLDAKDAFILSSITRKNDNHIGKIEASNSTAEMVKRLKNMGNNKKGDGHDIMNLIEYTIDEMRKEGALPDKDLKQASALIKETYLILTSQED